MTTLQSDNYQYRVLIIEDNENWYVPMIEALNSELKALNAKTKQQNPEVNNVSIDIKKATDKSSAKNASLKHRLHLLSHDLHIPESTNLPMNVSIGTEHMKDYDQLLLPQLVYSAHLKGDAGLAAARTSGTLNAFLFHKRAGKSLDSEDTPAISPTQWASIVMWSLGLSTDAASLPESMQSKIAFYERLRYEIAYWHRAVRLLPDPLAVVADSFCHALIDGERLRYAHLFYEWTLKLAWAQTAVLLSALGKRTESRLTDDQISSQINELKDWLNDRNNAELLKQCPSWRSHLTIAGRGNDGLFVAWNAMRHSRNQFAHSLRPLNAPDKLWSDLQPALRVIKDIAAFWAQFPLFTRPIRFGSHWQVTALRGTARQGETITLPADSFDTTPAANGVYQRIPLFHGDTLTWQTLDWQPWLQMLPDRDHGANRPWLVSHRDKAGRWVLASLTHNETRTQLPR